MIDLLNRRCKCSKHIPHFNYPGLKAEYCSKCKTEGMIDVKHKRYKKSNTKS